MWGRVVKQSSGRVGGVGVVERSRNRHGEAKGDGAKSETLKLQVEGRALCIVGTIEGCKGVLGAVLTSFRY